MKKIFFLLPAVAVALTFGSCSTEDYPWDPNAGTYDTDDEDDSSVVTEAGEIPTYDDDYSSISDWSYHLSWNLANVHDPSVAYYNGTYYMFGTDASYGNAHEGHGHFQGKYSTDLVNWTWCSGIFNDNTRPTWIVDSLNSIRSRMGLDAIAESNISFGYWAPVVRTVTVDGVEKLRMYYSVVIDNYIKTGAENTTANWDGSWTERAFIGMAESTDPQNGVWEDKGYVVCSSSDKGRDGWARSSSSDYDAYFYYNAIDPTYIVVNGNHYLIYGSWHSGFALLQIDPSTGKPVNTLGEPWADSTDDLTSRYGVRVGTRTSGSRWQGSEGPEIIYKDGYYYLFMAYDALDVAYNTRVVRSTSIDGPYYDITGRNFTNGRGDCYPIVTHPYKFSGHSGWVGISHCCIFQENGTDNWFYMSQGRLPANTNGNSYSNAIMMGHVRRIVWCPASTSDTSNLWPIALPERYAGIDDSAVTEDELVGEWEHINLVYSYGNQDASESLTLAEDGTMSGALNGTWSFNADKQWLTLTPSSGTAVIVVVAREADWEASPRVATIVYAGTEQSLNATYWGKKVE